MRLRISYKLLAIVAALSASAWCQTAPECFRDGESLLKAGYALKAARAFEQAVALDGGNDRYRQRLDQVRVQASKSAEEAARQFLSMGKLNSAQVMLFEAKHFDSGNVAAATLLATVNKQLVEAEAAKPKAKDARLTNLDVTRMLTMGLDSEVIVAKIKSSPSNFDTSVDALGELKKSGASSAVMLAVMEKPRGPAPLDPSEAPAPSEIPALREIKALFIEQMANGLEQYIRAELTKQMNGRVTVVLRREDADAILVGVGDQKDGVGQMITGRYLGLHDTSVGSISLLDREGRVVIWSSEAGDRSIWWGPLTRSGVRKVAERLVHNLKSAMAR